MLYFSCDLHKKTTTITVKRETGENLSQKRLPNDKNILRQFITGFKGDKTGTVEATFNWYWFVDFLEECMNEVILANPARTSVKNRTHAILHKNGIIQPFSDLFCFPLLLCYKNK